MAAWRGLITPSIPTRRDEGDVVDPVDQRDHLPGAELLGEERPEDVCLLVVGDGDEKIGVLDVLLPEQFLARPVTVQDDGLLQAGRKVLAPVLPFSMILTVMFFFSIAPASIRPVLPPPMMMTRRGGSVSLPKKRRSSRTRVASATANR